MTHALLDTTKVVGNLTVEGAPFEVCAEAIANHDRHSNQLTVNLSAFLRAAKLDHIGETKSATWLPAPQVVTEHVGQDEAHDLVNDIFSSWCHKVAASSPA